MTRERELLTLLESHGAALRRIAGVYAGAQGEEEDLYQEILLQAWKSLPSFRGESSGGTWLYRVALNTALTWRRRTARRSEHRAAMREIPWRASAGVEPTPDRSEEEILSVFLDSLNGPNRSVLILYMEGLTHQEIADVTGLSASAVGVRIHRMKNAFCERFVEGSDS